MQLAVRKRSARLQVLQEMVDRMRQVIVTRAVQYADDPVGATGMMVKDCRGKNGEKVVWNFDAALNAQILNILKQAAREEGQWGAKQNAEDEERKWKVVMDILNAGRDRVAKEQHEREAAEAAKAGQPLAIDGEIA